MQIVRTQIGKTHYVEDSSKLQAFEPKMLCGQSIRRPSIRNVYPPDSGELVTCKLCQKARDKMEADA